MKTFFSEIIPKLQRYSQKLDNLTLLTNQHWVLIDEETQSKHVYIFRTNNDLLLSTNGKVDKGRWEYLGNNALLIERSEGTYLFRHGFFDENVLALKVDGKEEYAFFINENRYTGEVNSLNKVLDFLDNKYLLTYNDSVKETESQSLPLIEEIQCIEGTPRVYEKFWSGEYSEIPIKFEDGMNGFLHYSSRNGLYFFIDRGWKVFYRSKQSAIRALQYYLLNNKVLEEDHLYTDGR